VTPRGMRPHDTFAQNRLEQLFAEAQSEQLDGRDRYVVFSDLHMGNGGKGDGFRHNADLFHSVLERHYLPEEYRLILNGDVEELQRFSLRAIQNRWEWTYRLFDRFRASNRFCRLIGNHDLSLMEMPEREVHESNIREALRLDHHGHTVFIFHGHQPYRRYRGPNRWVDFVLRYGARPLRIRHPTPAHDSRKRFAMERCVYEFSSRKKIMSVIGHTHRPLFESLSKRDTIKFQIEMLCRTYPSLESARQREVEDRIVALKEELESIAEDEASDESTSLYNANLVVPCLFNSGCVLGKRGITALEIDHGVVRLVYWFDRERPQKYLRSRKLQPQQLDNTRYFRVILNEDHLDYIFTLIRLLS